MKAKLFREFLLAVSGLLGSNGSTTSSKAWLEISQIFDVSGSVKDVCKHLSGLDISPEHRGPTINDVLVSVPSTKYLLMQAAKNAVLEDFDTFANSITPLARGSISFLVAAMREKPAKSSSKQQGNESVQKYLARLESTLEDEVAFLEAFNAVKTDSALKAPDIKELGRAFTKQSSKSKADALQRIWDRHASLIRDGARAKATSGRTAA